MFRTANPASLRQLGDQICHHLAAKTDVRGRFTTNEPGEGPRGEVVQEALFAMILEESGRGGGGRADYPTDAGNSATSSTPASGGLARALQFPWRHRTASLARCSPASTLSAALRPAGRTSALTPAPRRAHWLLSTARRGPGHNGHTHLPGRGSCRTTPGNTRPCRRGAVQRTSGRI